MGIRNDVVNVWYNDRYNDLDRLLKSYGKSHVGRTVKTEHGNSVKIKRAFLYRIGSNKGIKFFLKGRFSDGKFGRRNVPYTVLDKH